MLKDKRKLLKYSLHIIILVGVVVAAVKYLNGEEFMQAVRTFKYRYIPIMLGLAAVYMALNAWRFVILTRAIAPEAKASTIFRIFWAGQAATLLPGGFAVRAGMLAQAGVPVGKGAVAVTFASLLDQTVLISGSIIAALWFPQARGPVFILIGVLAVAGALLLIPAVRAGLVRLIDKLARRFDKEEMWQEFQDSAQHELRPKTMLTSLAITIVGYALMPVILYFALLGIGQSLMYHTLFLAYVLPALLARLTPIPGGVGVTEAGMVGFLASAGIGTNPASVAVAVFRISTTLWQAIMGTFVYMFAWHGSKEDAIQAQPSAPAQSESTA